MDILGVQIVAVLFAIFMIYVTFLYWKRKDFSAPEIFFWIALWVCFIIVTLFPDILLSLTKKLFFARVLDLLMVVAFMILAFMGFQNHVANRRMEKKLEDLVRKEALNALKKKRS